MRQRQWGRLEALLPVESRRRYPNDVWDRMEPREKIEGLAQQSLDNCRLILDLPIEMAIQSPTVMTGKTQVVRAILATLTKVGIESRRLTAMQDEMLGQLLDEFDAEEDANPFADGEAGGWKS